MKNFLYVAVLTIAMCSQSYASDRACVKTRTEANSILEKIIEDAREYFNFGNYLEADANLFRAFQIQNCSQPPIISINGVDGGLRREAITLYALVLWEKGDHTRLKGFSEAYFKDSSKKAWTCRVHLYSGEYDKSAKCFSELGEIARSQRDYRTEQITEILRRDLD